tara:strand:+ start:1067 stop:1498 length:432 start_codon:yes stop_codon:yes gene_type:complete
MSEGLKLTVTEKNEPPPELFSNNQPVWQMVQGELKQICVSQTGDHIWGVNELDNIYYRNGIDASWERVEGFLKQLSVDGDHVWGVNKFDNVYYRNGRHGEWLRVEGFLKQVHVSNGGAHVWGVNDANEIYFREGIDGSWKKMS